MYFPLSIQISADKIKEPTMSLHLKRQEGLKDILQKVAFSFRSVRITKYLVDTKSFWDIFRIE